MAVYSSASPAHTGQYRGCCRWLETLAARLQAETAVFRNVKPNHVLLNAYKPGQGIYNHQDGPIYQPGVCILSTGGSAVINFRKKLPDGKLPWLIQALLLIIGRRHIEWKFAKCVIDKTVLALPMQLPHCGWCSWGH